MASVGGGGSTVHGVIGKGIARMHLKGDWKEEEKHLGATPARQSKEQVERPRAARKS